MGAESRHCHRGDPEGPTWSNSLFWYSNLVISFCTAFSCSCSFPSAADTDQEQHEDREIISTYDTYEKQLVQRSLHSRVCSSAAILAECPVSTDNLSPPLHLPLFCETLILRGGPATNGGVKGHRRVRVRALARETYCAALARARAQQLLLHINTECTKLLSELLHFFLQFP